jgi:hypothetical protein
MDKLKENKMDSKENSRKHLSASECMFKFLIQANILMLKY